MSHYINLLDEQECVYVSAVAANPLYKVGGAALGVLILGMAWNYYSSLTGKINEGEKLTSRWGEIEKTVAEAQARADNLLQLERDIETLRGWSTSRYPWPEVLNHLATEIPAPTQNLQFTRLFFDEKVEGLRDHNPSAADLVHPLRREVTIDLRGRLLADRSDQVLGQYERNLMQVRKGIPQVVKVQLQGNRGTTIGVTEVAGVTPFTFFLELEPRSMKP